jgi:hypothetical protein
MFQASTAHHQEVRCRYVEYGTSKMAVSKPASNGTYEFDCERKYVNQLTYSVGNRTYSVCDRGQESSIA